MSSRDERAIAIASYLVERGYPADSIKEIVEFLLPTTQMASIGKNVIKVEDEESLFALAGLD